MGRKIQGGAPSHSLRDSPTPSVRQHGPVEVLCREIGFPWNPRLERTDLFVAFVRELIAEVATLRHVQEVAAKMGGKPPSEGSAEVLLLAEGMLSFHAERALMAGASLMHQACWRLNPDDTYPTDHIIDMLSSCASAIRFGLEPPHHSRHAAEAANHVWKQVYGVSRFDQHTPEWGHSWARSKLTDALITLLPPTASTSTRKDGASPKPDGPS